MPHDNRFRHQDYFSPRPESLASLITADPVADDALASRRMACIGRGFRNAGVAAIVLVHGTFVGNDALGVLRDISRFWPAAAELMHRYQKSVVDRYLQDLGNYTNEFALRMQQRINVDLGTDSIPVRLFHWSSENHHLGRFEGALQLIEQLEHSGFEPGSRVLLWGHSHGGNLFALISNLLAADAETLDRVFDAARCYYHWPILNKVDRQVWPRVHDLLGRGDARVRRLHLDFATFGTPIRYGWDSGGYGRLMHFIYHRPTPGCPPHSAKFPPTVDDVIAARYGDYIQQFGIAGTNLWPGLFHAFSVWAEFRLARIVQEGFASRRLLEYLRTGTRIADEGPTLLVDYTTSNVPGVSQIAGHSIYTRMDCMLFHLEQVYRIFYSLRSR